MARGLDDFNLSRWAVNRPAMTLFLILALAVAGLAAYFRLGRAEDPAFTIKVSVVTVVWPGASAAEMRDQVSDLIEKKLQELPHLDRIETYSKPSVATLQVIFRDSTPPAEIPDLFYQMRKKLHDIRNALPAGVLDPSVNDEWGDVDSELFTVSSDTASYRQLKDVAEMLRKRLLAVPDAMKVNFYGEQAPRIFVEFNDAKLATLGLSPQTIFDSIARQNAVVSAGTFETGASRVRVQVSGAAENIDQIANIPVEANGRSFRLGDIATVVPGFEDPPSFVVRSQGRKALAVGVVMAKGGNIIAFGRNIKDAAREVKARVPLGIEVASIADQPMVVQEAVGEFTRSFAEALIIVLVVSFLSLGLRAGLVVALSVPLVLAIAFVAMYAMNIDLQRISLGALIIALGLLVDDAIIAVEMMVVKMSQGVGRLAAASYAWKSTAFPMLTGTLVTVAGFIPVGFAASSTGEYTGTLFWVLMVCLVASWLVAVLFVPYLGVVLLPKTAKGSGHHDDSLYETRFYRKLRRVVTWSVDHRRRVLLITLGIFVTAALGFTHVQKQFFPLSERTELFLQMQLAEGASIEATTNTVREAEKLLAGDKDIASYTAYIGQGPPRFWLAMKPELPNESYGEIVIVARDLAARERIKYRLERAYAQGALAQARVRVDRFNFGPPVGYPVQFRVIGPEPAEVRDIAYRVRDEIRKDRDIVDPHLNWNELAPSVRLVIDQDRARGLGLTSQDISTRLQMMLSGVTVTTVREGTDQVDVVARLDQAGRSDVGRLEDMTIVSRDGVAVPVSQVARIVYQYEEPIYWRRNRETTITVRSDVRDGVQAPDVSARLLERLGTLTASLPAGYRIEAGGAIEESAKANASIYAVFPIMLLLMLLIVMSQVQNFTRLGLVMMSAPLGVIGASLALNVTNAPFGFVALLGLIALSGMEMRNSIILVDQARQDLEDGATYREAIIGATVRRARPVALTALAAILAMVPLSRSTFWGPMALTIMGGLFVATFITVLFLPALYAFWFRASLDRGLDGYIPPVPEPAEALPPVPTEELSRRVVGLR